MGVIPTLGRTIAMLPASPTRSYVYRQMDAAKLVGNLSPMGDKLNRGRRGAQTLHTAIDPNND